MTSDDYVMVTQEELTGILQAAMDAGDFTALRPYEEAPDGRTKVPCDVWCQWVKEGYTQ